MTSNEKSSAILQRAPLDLGGFAKRVLSEVSSKVPSDRRARVVDTAQWLIRQSTSTNFDHVSIIAALKKRGISNELVIDYSIPIAARALGEDWANDLRGFGQVTLATSRLAEVVKELSLRPQNEFEPRDLGILMAASRHEQHTLGLQIAADQIRRMGYSVKLLLGADTNEVVGLCKTGEFSTVILSVAGEHALPKVLETVMQIRHSATNDILIALGGQIVEIEPEKPQIEGIDLYTNEIEDVVLEIKKRQNPNYAVEELKIHR